MKRISRCITLLGVACLLAFGSVGDSQVPGDIVPSSYLRDQTDVGAFHAVLARQSPQWTSLLDSQNELLDLRFRRVISTSQSRVYLGGVTISEGISLGTSSGAVSVLAGPDSSVLPGRHAFGYLHVLGSGFATPPDQLFRGRGPRSSTKEASLASRLFSRDQLEFLMFGLEGLSGQGQDPELVGLGNWFAGQNDVILENFWVDQVGSDLQLDLFFRSLTSPDLPVLVRSIQATRIAAMSFDQVVVK